MSNEAASAAASDQAATPEVAPAATFKWLPLPREYARERTSHLLRRTTTRIHPLLSKSAISQMAPAAAAAAVVVDPLSSSSSSSASTIIDPLSSPLGFVDPLSPSRIASPKPKEVFDPLRMMAASSAAVAVAAAQSQAVISTIEAVSFGAVQSAKIEQSSSSSSSSGSSSSSSSRKSNGPTDGYEPWRDKRASILTKYTTNAKIPVQANFLQEEKVQAPKAVDSAKSRLEELETASADALALAAAQASGADASGKISMTQREYIHHIEEQHDCLKVAWEAGDRVKSLKIAIQCAKLLGDATVPQFYPSMYVLLTDILDTFGDLVFERIKSKGIDVFDPQTKARSVRSLPVNFKNTDVSPSAAETCRNWFYKTACIRELIPRLYIDMCLLKCYRFVDTDESYPNRFGRLSRMIRGIGDPLAATYARAYLATKCGDVHNSFTNNTAKAGQATSIPKAYQSCLIEGFDDFLFTFKSMLAGENVLQLKPVRDNKINRDDYIDLFSPALEWLLQNIGYQSNEELFFGLLQQYKDYCNCSAVLVHILASFEPSFVSNHALDMTTVIKASTEIPAVPRSRLYLALGRALIRHAPPQAQRLPILNDVWKVVTKIVSPTEYIEIASVFVQYLLINFTEREVNIFLKDVIKHLKTDDRAYQLVQDTLAQIVDKILLYSADLNRTLSMDHFLPIMDLLEKQQRVDASKAVLVRFSLNGFTTSDPIIIHTLFDVARSCHDSIDSLSFDDDRKQISLLIINFIRQIDFGRDLEQLLTVYVECRQSFTSLDMVTQELVLQVALLCMKAHRFMKGSHSKKTSAFVKACLAYAHITIPSLDDIFSKLRLLLICGEVALVNSMIVQSEGFLKAAISLLPDVPPLLEVYKLITSTDDDLVQYLRNFTSFLLLFPGHPEHGPFYLVKGMLNAVQTYEPWRAGVGIVSKAKVYLGVFSLFCTYAQRNFPYTIAKVESNDTLYGGDANYVAGLVPFLDTLVSEILELLGAIGERGDTLSKKQQATLALDFVNVLITSVTMNAASATLVVKLVGLAQKNSAADQAYVDSTIRYIQSKRSVWYQDIASKITTKV